MSYKKMASQIKMQLAVILANIKQESGFNPLACEGYYPRLTTGYWDCYNNTRGGFGLLQWTSEGRIKGLGAFCASYKCDPNTVAGQMRYLVNEYDYRLVRPVFNTPGLPLQEYKDASFAWIRWGITETGGLTQMNISIKSLLYRDCNQF